MKSLKFKNHIKISKENTVEDEVVATSKFEEAFDEAVRNGASADELSKIRREFYKEGQIQNGGKLELKDEYVDKYAIMNRVISAQREFERGQNSVDAEDSKERRGLFDKMRNSKFGNYLRNTGKLLVRLEWAWRCWCGCWSGVERCFWRN